MSSKQSKRKKKKKKHMHFMDDTDEVVSWGTGDNVYVKDDKGNWVKKESTTTPSGHTNITHYSGTGANQTKSTIAVCKHYGDIAFTTTTGIEFYGATGWCADIGGIDTVFDLAYSVSSGAISNTRRVSSYVKSGLLQLNELLEPMPTFVDIAWPDMDIMPQAGAKFWNGVKEYIDKRAEGNDHTLIMATCTGGNGRTGSFLAIMYGLYAGAKGQASIDYIRDHYCEHAIETARQETYIKWVLDGTPLY